MTEIILYHYFLLNGFLAIGFIFCKFLYGNIFLRDKISPQQHLILARFMLLFIPCIYCLMAVLKTQYISPQLFSFKFETTNLSNHIYTGILLSSTNHSKLAYYLSLILICSIASMIIAKTILLISQLGKLHRILQDGIVIRIHKNLNIIVSNSVSSPFCFSFLKKSHVVMTYQILEKSNFYRIAIKHELQHLRQKDTSWVFVYELFKIFFCINPFIYKWIKYNLELQELACDEILINKKSIHAQDYANCLVAVAEATNEECYMATIGFFQSKPSLITRRINMLFEYKKIISRKFFLAFLVANILLSGVVATTAYAIISPTHQPKDSDVHITGQYVGIGIEITSNSNGTFKVIQPVKGSPADRAGIKPGDVIIKIDNKASESMSLSEAIEHLNGKIGTTVSLTLMRTKNPKPFKLTFIRENIQFNHPQT